MNRILYWHGAALGAGATAAYLIWKLGWPLLDGFVLSLLAIVVACGAILGGGIVLAWRHIRRSPRILRPTVGVLIVLSLPPVACYQREKQHTPTFLASADSVRGVVTGRNVFGNLLITFPEDSSHLARMVAPKKHAHDQFASGDSIWVYQARPPSHRVDVWPPGPDWLVTTVRLLWFWGIAGVLLAGYGPLFKREPPTSERAVAESSGGAA